MILVPWVVNSLNAQKLPRNLRITADSTRLVAGGDPIKRIV